MRPFEAVVIVYLAFFAVAALFARVAAPKRAATAFGAASMSIAIYLVARAFPLELRLWGHVAVSVAAAIGAAKVWPAAGVVLGVVAAAVAVGAVVGRYHYVADVVLGAAVGVAASL